MQWVLWTNIAATWFMTGLIWFVQVVHYPLFAEVGESGFADYAAKHQHLTGLVVIVPMLVELLTAALLVFQNDSPLPVAWATAGLALVVLIWGSTFLLQVPEHARLSGGLDPDAVSRLVATNWIRTVAWTLRAGMLFGFVAGR